MANKVKIKIRAFPYYEDAVDPVSGQDTRIERIARRGDEIELSDADYQRAQRFDAFYTETDESIGESAGDATLSAETASPEQLANWIKDSKPTVDETVDAAEGDPVLAQRLLDAENLATGQQPRKGVEEGLRAVIANG